MNLHGYDFHSPKEIHPVITFYGSHAQFALECNIRRSERPGLIEDYVALVQSDASFVDLCMPTMDFATAETQAFVT